MLLTSAVKGLDSKVIEACTVQRRQRVQVEEDEMAHLVANRQGEVLGPHAILKEDHFPGDTATTPLLTPRGPSSGSFARCLCSFPGNPCTVFIR